LYYLAIPYETWSEDTFGSYKCWVIFGVLKQLFYYFLTTPNLMSTLAIFGRILVLFLTQKCKFEAQYWDTRTFTKLTQSYKGFWLKLINFPPSIVYRCSKCTTLVPLRKCKEYNFIFPKMKMVEKENLQVRKNISFLRFFSIFLLF